jgi:hypothetical protein
MFFLRLIWAVVGCSPTALLKTEELYPILAPASLMERRGEMTGVETSGGNADPRADGAVGAGAGGPVATLPLAVSYVEGRGELPVIELQRAGLAPAGTTDFHGTQSGPHTRNLTNVGAAAGRSWLDQAGLRDECAVATREILAEISVVLDILTRPHWLYHSLC